MTGRGIKQGMGEGAGDTDNKQRKQREKRKKSELSPLNQPQFPVHEWFGVMTLNGCNKGKKLFLTLSNPAQNLQNSGDYAAFIALLSKLCVCEPRPLQPTT